MAKPRSGRSTARARSRAREVIPHLETLPAGIRPLYLHEEFAAAAPAKYPGPNGLIGRLSLTQMRFALWGRCEGLSAIRIAEALGLHLSTVKELWMKTRNDAGITLDCRFVHKVRLGQTKSTVRWWCRYCGDTYRTSGTAATHAYGHLFDEEDNF